MTDQAQKLYYNLTFFDPHHILKFYDYFTSKRIDIKENCKNLIKFVNPNAQLQSFKRISRDSHDHFEILREIGNRLESIFNDLPKQSRELEKRKILQNDLTVFVVAYNDKLLLPNVIMSLYVNSGNYPEPWQLFICASTTTMDELEIFIKRCFGITLVTSNFFGEVKN